MQYSKIIGSILILIGTCIGAGVLALPMVSAASGFFMTLLLMFGVWLIMTILAVLILEVNLACPESANSFHSMARITMGKLGQVITWIAYLGLLYSLLSAYVAGGTTLFEDLLYNVTSVKLPLWTCGLLFVSILGGVVFWSTQAVDYANRALITGKGLLLFTTISLLLLYINPAYIYYSQVGYSVSNLWRAAPFFVFAFGHHIAIPSLRCYIGPKRKELLIVVLGGCLVPLIIYVLWLAATLGTVPLIGATNSYTAINAAGNDVAGLINVMSNTVPNHWVATSMRWFSNISMTTSFLGVSLALFDFLADGLRRASTKRGRFQTALLTLIPPIGISLFFPGGFIAILGHAIIFVAILLFIMPAVMAYLIRKEIPHTIYHKILFNKFFLGIIIFIAVALVALQLWKDFN